MRWICSSSEAKHIQGDFWDSLLRVTIQEIFQPSDESLTHVNGGPISCHAVSRAVVWFPGEVWQVPLPPPQPHRQQRLHCGGRSTETPEEMESLSSLCRTGQLSAGSQMIKLLLVEWVVKITFNSVEPADIFRTKMPNWSGTEGSAVSKQGSSDG